MERPVYAKCHLELESDLANKCAIPGGCKLKSHGSTPGTASDTAGQSCCRHPSRIVAARSQPAGCRRGCHQALSLHRLRVFPWRSRSLGYPEGVRCCRVLIQHGAPEKYAGRQN